ncbi:MAG: hypothetical protein Q8R36_00730 [bacterium]|nr:hypothetical protein [bacterium]
MDSRYPNGGWDKNYAKFIIFGGFAFIATVIGVLFFTFLNLPNLSLPPSVDSFRNIKNTMSFQDPFRDLKGAIYLTLSQQDEKLTDLYVFNTLDKTINRLFPFDKFGNKFIGFTNKYSPQNNMMAYITATRSSVGPLSLMVWEREPRDWFAVDRSPLWFKRLPQWSPDEKKITFTAAKQKSSFDIINEWDIYVTDLKGNVSRITHGTYPFWSPDGNDLLFLRNDGLYIHDLARNESIKVYSIPEGSIKINTQLGISSDGSLLALSEPSAILVFQISSWEPFQMELTRRIYEKAEKSINNFYWPVFSPDNRYLVVQATTVDSKTLARSDQRLVVYELDTFKSKILTSLDDYGLDYTFVTDWRY